MAVSINKKGEMVIETTGKRDYEHWLSTRKAIIESIQFQKEDVTNDECNYYLLDLLLDLEPTTEQAKKMFT